MQVHCRCGQEFEVHAERFPHQVSCHVCGFHFNVLDDGEVMELSAAKPAAPSAGTDITASPPAPLSNAICSDEHEQFIASLNGLSVHEQLQKIDQRWQEFRQKAEWSLFGLRISPSKRKALAIAATFFFRRWFLCRSASVGLLVPSQPLRLWL